MILSLRKPLDLSFGFKSGFAICGSLTPLIMSSIESSMKKYLFEIGSIIFRFTAKIFSQLNNAHIHKISGPHPAGNVGTQIHHIRPINKGDIKNGRKFCKRKS